MTRTLKRIAPLAMGKAVGGILALLSLILAPFFLLAGVGALVASALGKAEMNNVMPFIGFAVLGVIMPLIYGLMGFIQGTIVAVAYNFVVRYTGGIEVEVE